MKLDLEAIRKAALELYVYEPPPTKRGANAGSRKEGVAWRDAMIKLLAREGAQVETCIGKATDGTRLDGNACERVGYKMLSFKLNPLNRERWLVIALNEAFVRYDNPYAMRFKEMAAYLNGVNSNGMILVLATPSDYEAYLANLI